MNKWYKDNPKLFSEFESLISSNYPTLLVGLENESVHLRGTLHIKNELNVILDSFSVDIKVPDDFPNEIPEFREIGGRIPLIADRHFEKDGRACLCFRDAVFFYWSVKSSIIDFIKLFVEPFLKWQIEYELTGGKNSSKAFGHGVFGELEFYGSILNTNDRYVIKIFVEYLSKNVVKGHWSCYCGSGKRIRDCHLENLITFKKKIRRKDSLKTLLDFNNFKIGIR